MTVSSKTLAVHMTIMCHEAFYDGEVDHCLLQAEILNIIKHNLF